MSRSIKKGPFVQPKLYERVQKMNENGEKIVLKTWSRSSTIFPDFVGHTFAVASMFNTLLSTYYLPLFEVFEPA